MGWWRARQTAAKHQMTESSNQPLVSRAIRDQDAHWGKGTCARVCWLHVTVVTTKRCSSSVSKIPLLSPTNTVHEVTAAGGESFDNKCICSDFLFVLIYCRMVLWKEKSEREERRWIIFLLEVPSVKRSRSVRLWFLRKVFTSFQFTQLDFSPPSLPPIKSSFIDYSLQYSG